MSISVNGNTSIVGASGITRAEGQLAANLSAQEYANFALIALGGNAENIPNGDMLNHAQRFTGLPPNFKLG